MGAQVAASNGLRAALVAATIAAILAFWLWMGAPAPMPVPASSESRLPCLSYTPFRGASSPLTPATAEVSEADIADDLARLAPATRCVRTYSAAGFHLDRVPEFAARHGMTVLQGIWLSADAAANKREIEAGIALANKYPGTIRGVVVGNEVLLRRELPPEVLAGHIREVKARVTVPVTYADVWEFWIMHGDLAGAVDFVTVHMLPFWENEPTPVDTAVAHVVRAYGEVQARFPGKKILIGETGWPSAGRMRERALPSPINQARFVHEIANWVASHGADVNFIEAFDQPWKRTLEGTVGGYWGLYDSETRRQKFTWGAPVSNHPKWLLQGAAGVALALAVLALAWSEERRRKPLSRRAWLDIVAMALVCGFLCGLGLEQLWLGANGPGGLLRLAGLGALSLAAPVAAIMLVRGEPLPSLTETLSPSAAARPQGLRLAAGIVLVLTVLAALQVALALTFAPRYVDFPYAALTAAAAPLLILVLATGTKAARTGTAEIVAALVLGAASLFVVVNEGWANWQAFWLSAALALTALTLARLRYARSSE